MKKGKSQKKKKISSSRKKLLNSFASKTKQHIQISKGVKED